MKNTCPKCGTAYAVNASVIGRTFACKNCGSNLVVTAAGLDFNSPAPAAPAPAPMPAAPAPTPAGSAFDFDGPGGDDSGRPARKKKRASREDEEEEDFVPPVRVHRRNTGGGFGAYLAFREFLASIVIQVVFWLLAALITIGGLQQGVGMLDSRITMVQIAGGLVILVGIPLMILFVRIYCEFVLVMFGIYDRLGEIKDALRRRD